MGLKDFYVNGLKTNILYYIIQNTIIEMEIENCDLEILKVINTIDMYKVEIIVENYNKCDIISKFLRRAKKKCIVLPSEIKDFYETHYDNIERHNQSIYNINKIKELIKLEKAYLFTLYDRRNTLFRDQQLLL